MCFKHKNIGFFDSGIGGISVLKTAINIFKNEVFVYFGDSKNSPYGCKSQNEIIKLCINICDFLIYENNCKAIVVACNTASSAAIKTLRKMYEPKIIIVGIEPAIKPAMTYLKNINSQGNILVLATPFTINGEKFREMLNDYDKCKIYCIALSNLASMIEENLSREKIKDYLYGELKSYIKNVSCLVLGCTHYYFVYDIFKEVLGENIKIFDGSYGTSKELKRRIELNNYARESLDENEKRIYIHNSLNKNKVKRCYELLNFKEG